MGLLAGSLSSCEDLDIDPQQSLSTELAFADKQAVEGSLLGVYSLTQEFEVFGSLPQVIADFQSDNVDFIGSFPTLQDVRLYATQSDNTTIRDLWRRHYRAILAANAVIQFTPESPDESLTQEQRDQYVAEAKFMRALLMFQMVNLFAHPIQVAGESAPGIPIVTAPFTGEITGFPRSTVGEVHAFILDDLTAAVDDLPVSYDAANFTRGRATQGLRMPYFPGFTFIVESGNWLLKEQQTSWKTNRFTIWPPIIISGVKIIPNMYFRFKTPRLIMDEPVPGDGLPITILLKTEPGVMPPFRNICWQPTRPMTNDIPSFPKWETMTGCTLPNFRIL